ncbi:unannotated protein [freshwater metagenome]|uniref:Unannotated protein n=1 Tax=freshwater metagenome TaxID=449393 RepID=A0A6J7D2L9_9ZZZZ
MIPSLRFDRTVVAVRVGEVVNVLIELAAPVAPPVERPPLDVVVVLDRSGSMSGGPLSAVTAATAQLLRLAGPDDRIGVVAFDDDVKLVLPLARHDAVTAGRTVRAICAGGSTNLSGGWLKGLEMLLGAPRPDALRRIVLLTDGHANVGITDPGELVPLISSGRKQGITTSCIGFDDGYDEKLLAALADAGMGNDYWCAGKDQAAQVFTDEFAGLASVVAQNVSVEITPTASVAVVNVLNDFPITALPNDSLQVALGDAFGGETRRLIASFHLRPTPAEGPINVATVTIRWASTLGPVTLHTLTVPIVVAAGDGNAIDPAADPGVTEEVLVLEAARSRREAREAAESGDLDRASLLLQNCADLLELSGADGHEIEELRNDARSAGRGDWSAADSKKQFSRGRSMQRGRRSNYEAPIEPEDTPPV